MYVRGVRSIRLDDEEHAEAGPLLRWDFFSEVGVLAVDFNACADLGSVPDDRLPELCECRVEGGTWIARRRRRPLCRVAA